MSKVNSDLAAAIAAASLASDGPDLDAVLDELIAEAQGSRKVDIEALAPERPIGMGGQGGVWLARDPTTGIVCAVKQIRKGRLSSLPKKAATRALVEREALLEVGFHPFITTLHAAFQNDSSLFFALELAPGGDLFGLLDLHPHGLPEKQARFYCTCVALALRHVHACGWVYRDVKLENVLIDADGYGKICDFGFAKKAAATRTFTKCGTDEYAPPEVVSGRGRSCAADWWALGILLHEMLTGRPPFEGSSAEEVSGLTLRPFNNPARNSRLPYASVPLLFGFSPHSPLSQPRRSPHEMRTQCPIPTPLSLAPISPHRA
jgi:serine/threonine protein kinase